jgi:hypothetical protein
MTNRTLLPALSLALVAGCATPPRIQNANWPQYVLRADQVTLLNSPGGGRFDASGLLRTKTGALLTVSDRGPQLFQIAMRSSGAEADLRPIAGCFTAAQLAPLAPEKKGHYDCEGIAQDEQGRFYVCEEQNRWILRCDPKTSRVEQLSIDWSSVRDFFSTIDSNASFEGVAIGKGRLYVANERSAPLIIVVDLARLKVIGHFEVIPRTSSLFGTHYSDLSWFDERLWVLCRQHRVVLEVEPRTHQVMGEFDYRAVEDRLGYRKEFPVGIMEGLAVDREFIWLVTDNNGFERKGAPGDIRPTLLRCPRPDRSADGRAGEKGRKWD